MVEESHEGNELKVSATPKEKVASCIVAGRGGLVVWDAGEDQAPALDESVCNGNSVEFMGTSDANDRGG